MFFDWQSCEPDYPLQRRGHQHLVDQVACFPLHLSSQASRARRGNHERSDQALVLSPSLSLQWHVTQHFTGRKITKWQMLFVKNVICSCCVMCQNLHKALRIRILWVWFDINGWHHILYKLRSWNAIALEKWIQNFGSQLDWTRHWPTLHKIRIYHGSKV